MGRPKGSKNKSTLEKLALLGQPKTVPAPFSPFGASAPVTEITKEDVKILTTPKPAPVEPTPVLTIKETQDHARKMVDASVKLVVPVDVMPIAENAYRDALKEVAVMVKHFRAEAYTLPDRIKNKLLAIKSGKTCDEINLLKKKALDSVHLNYCYQWAKEVIPGAVLKHLARPKSADWGDKDSEKDS